MVLRETHEEEDEQERWKSLTGFGENEMSGCWVLVVDMVVKSVVGTEVKQLSAIENGFIKAFEEAITLRREREREREKIRGGLIISCL